MNNSVNKENFLYPRYPYRGGGQAENLLFNANLQEFALKINYLCHLETAGKISATEAYQQIELLWKFLSNKKDELGI